VPEGRAGGLRLARYLFAAAEEINPGPKARLTACRSCTCASCSTASPTRGNASGHASRLRSTLAPFYRRSATPQVKLGGGDRSPAGRPSLISPGRSGRVVEDQPERVPLTRPDHRHPVPHRGRRPPPGRTNAPADKLVYLMMWISQRVRGAAAIRSSPVTRMAPVSSARATWAARRRG